MKTHSKSITKRDAVKYKTDFMQPQEIEIYAVVGKGVLYEGAISEKIFFIQNS